MRSHTLKTRSEQSKLWMGALDPVRALLLRVQHQQKKTAAKPIPTTPPDGEFATPVEKTLDTFLSPRLTCPPSFDSPFGYSCPIIAHQPRVFKINDTVATIVGCGGGGTGIMIAGELLRRGCCAVRLYDISAEARAAAPKLMTSRLSQHVREGLLLPHDVPMLLRRLHVCDTLDEAVADTTLLVECVSEQAHIKRRAFADIVAAFTRCNVQPESVIICSNTIGVPLNTIADAVSPRFSARLLGMRFLFPFYFIDEVELLMNPKWCRFACNGFTERLNSSQPAMHTAEQMLKTMGFRPVRNTNAGRRLELVRALTAEEARLYCDRQRRQCASDAQELGVVYQFGPEDEIIPGDSSSTPSEARSTPSVGESLSDDEQRWSRAPGGACAANDYTHIGPSPTDRQKTCWTPI